MADNTWSSAGSTDGNLVGNWSLGALAATDNLLFNATSTVNCTFSGNITCAGWSMPGGYTGTIGMNTRTFDCTGNWVFGAAATISAGASLVTFTGAAAQSITMNGKCFYDITINRTTAGTLLFADAACAHTVVASATNTQAISWTGTTMSVSGNLTLDGSGTLNCGNGITATGSSSNVHFGSALGAVTATSCAVTMNTITAGVIDDDEGLALKSVSISGNCTNSGSATTGYTNGISLVLAAGAVFTVNAPITFTPNPVSGDIWTAGAGSSIAGTAAITWRVAGTVSINAPALTYTGSGQLTFRSNSSGSQSWSMTGALNFGTAPLDIAPTSAGGISFSTGGYALTAGVLRVGASPGAISFSFSAGSSIISVSSFNGSTYNDAIGSTINLQTSQWSVSGSFTFGSNHTITGTAASQSVTITNTSTVTSNGKAFPGTFAINAAGKTITLADDLTIATGGGVTVTAFTAFAGGKYVIFAGSGSITISTAVSNRLRTAVAGSTITWNTGANTWTVPAYAASDWGPAAGAMVIYQSLNPGTRYRIELPVAGITVSRMDFQDMNATVGVVTANDGTSRTRGNNVNLLTFNVVTETPITGSDAGGTVMTFVDTGNGFGGTCTVTVGGVAATSITVVDSQHLTAVTPAGAVGPAVVVVTNGDGDTRTLAGAFIYASNLAGGVSRCYISASIGI